MLDIIRNRAQSWGVKIIFGIIILVFVFWGMGSFTSNNPDIIMRVNGKIINRQAYGEELKRYAQAVKARMPNLPNEYFESEEQRRRVLGIMVDKILLLQAAENLGLSASVAEVQKEIASMPAFLDENQQFSLEQYNQVLSSNRITKADFEKGLMDSILLGKLQNYIMSAASASEQEALANFRFMEEKRKINYIFLSTAEFLDKVQVSDESIASYYEQNKADFTVPRKIDVEFLHITPQALASRYDVSQAAVEEYYNANKQRFVEEPKAKISHILFALDRNATPENTAKIAEKANKVYAEAKAGANFSALAKSNSDDPSAANGGDMGWIAAKDLFAVFAQAIEPLNAGEVTKPFPTPMGIHILKVEARQEATQKELNEVKDQIRLLIASEQAAKEMPDILDKTVADILNAKPLSDIAKDISLATETASQLQRSDIERELGINAQSVDILFLTPEGITVDKPLPSGSGYIFVRIVKVNEEHIAPLPEVKDRIVALLRTEEAKAMASRKGTEVLEQLKAEAKLPDFANVKVSDFFSRQAAPEEFGTATEMLQAVFSTNNKEEWLGPFTVGKGVVLAKLNEVSYPDQDTWNEIKGIFTMRLKMFKQEGLLAAYLQALQAKAKIEDYNPQNIGLE